MAITLVKEDGTGLANANVYADLAEADQYLENSDRRTAWRAFSSKERSAALIQGADYLDQTYRRRYKGIRFSSAQRLEWPRDEVFDELGVLVPANEIPEEIGLFGAGAHTGIRRDGTRNRKQTRKGRCAGGGDDV
jgi:hypothetical protein